MEKHVWGTSIWYFFHTIAEKIKPEKFDEVKPAIMEMTSIIFSNLPCPDCATHAREDFNKIKVQNIKTREDMITLYWQFHNRVNKRLKKPEFSREEMSKYEKAKFPAIYHNFNIVYNAGSGYNEKLLGDALQRRIQNNRLYTLINQIIPCLSI